MDIFFICLGLLVAPFAIWGVIILFRDVLGKSKTVQARVKSKSSEEDRYSVVFDIDGETRRFSVSKDVYITARKDSFGTLTFHGNRFLKFVPRK